MERAICIQQDEIRLLFAQESDRRFLYDLTFEDESVVSSMFHNADEFHWEEIQTAAPVFFDGTKGLSKYLFIEYQQEIIGVFCHDHHDAPINTMEFHIWMRASKYTGRGIGSRVLNMMIPYIHETYGITTFLMRPWIHNPRAVHVYEKCGFKIVDPFDLSAHFTKEEIEKYGNGAYTVEETVNMVLTLS